MCNGTTISFPNEGSIHACTSTQFIRYLPGVPDGYQIPYTLTEIFHHIILITLPQYSSKYKKHPGKIWKTAPVNMAY